VQTTGLAHNYGVLTCWERLPLLVAAAARGDTVEVSRLTRSAPTETFRVTDCRAVVQGLAHLAHSYLLRQLDRVVLIWQMTSLLEHEPLGNSKQCEGRIDDRLLRAARATARCFVVFADAWQLFCERLGIDSEVPLRGLPGYAAVQQTHELARSMACTSEEMIAWLKEAIQREHPPTSGAPDYELSDHAETAEDLARNMLTYLESELAIWS
jgi:hypothetical protein